MPMRQSGGRLSEETRARIVEAALETVRREGIVGTSARAIAQTGGFAPGLLFYHFGSVTEVLVAAVEQLAARRVERYAEGLRDVTSAPELVRVARALHTEDVTQGHTRILVQMLAATATDPDLGPRLSRAFEPWIALVHATLDRVVGGSPVRSLFPTEDGAHALTALFLGLELLAHLGGDFAHDERVFDAFDRSAAMLAPLLGLGGARLGGPA
jgi:AcrR family transcriptional regulator